jgi:hypothetical protein
MNNFKIIALSLVCLSITACDKVASQAHSRFVEMCKEDPRAKSQGFDCDCQADIIQAVLKDNEMADLVHFLDVEKQDRNKAIELGKDPKYTPMFQKIAGIGLAIHDKCSKPGATPAVSEPATPAPAAAVPATQNPPAKEAAPAKSEPAAK